MITFMVANISLEPVAISTLSAFFDAIGQPTRLKILLAIGEGEACVCHLESRLGMRQAVISQHLMVLRDAHLVEAERSGRNIFYHLAHPEFIDHIIRLGEILGIPSEELLSLSQKPYPGCPCPQCSPPENPLFSCTRKTSESNETELKPVVF
uniref:ArsR family transcriptional regulator n=1 Tax=Anaerolinea thermolimosa TaxID=229919 RepID=A0A7C4KI66_9CHLR